MSLSIGVVNVRYLEEPAQPILQFMADLRSSPTTGLDAYYGDLDARGLADPLGDDREDEHWEDGGFCEFRRAGMMRRATGWATEKSLSQSERTLLLDWLANLPWNDDYIILHLGY